MEFPGYVQKAVMPNNIADTVSGRTVDTTYRVTSSDGKENIAIYFRDGSCLTIAADADKLKVSGEFLEDSKKLHAGYGGTFFHLGNLEIK